MMSNEQMRANRYGKWADARRMFRQIQETLQSGGVVQVTTYTRSTLYQAKHSGMFSARKDGVYVQSGKSVVCLNSCAIRFGKRN